MPDAAAEAALTRSSLETARHLYAEYGRGNRAAVLDALAPDVSWTSVAGPELPWGGTCRGREGVEAYFARLNATLRITAYEIERTVAQGEWVVVLARATGRFLPTGEDVTLAKADAMRLRDVRLLEFREYYDTAAALAALGRCDGAGRQG
jgi:ketosteroid isomerase-like protein